ncbi:hypothetical protein ABTN04_18960 [Acinetobacter baumannii]
MEQPTTKPKHPWTNAQVDRMNRKIKDAAVKRYQYDDHEQIERHRTGFVTACNFTLHLKSPHGLTP